MIILDGKGEGRIGVRLNVPEEDLKAFLDKTGNEKDTTVTYKVVSNSSLLGLILSDRVFYAQRKYAAFGFLITCYLL